jgi:uncharacterized protein DUF4167
MRQGQHKQRSRGRGRKVHNPSNRSYDSNGPDVKIRGNAAHIAEKYSTLARDAQVSGDRIASENYLQHAEHYNRIVAANQAHLQQQQIQSQPQQQQETGGATEAEAGGTASEEVSSVGDVSVKSEEEAPKARSNNTRPRRRRSPTGRNSSGASDKNAVTDTADKEEAPVAKPEAASKSEVAAPELDQTAAE